MPRHECPGGHFVGGTTMPTTPASPVRGGGWDYRVALISALCLL